ncbi:MAG: hypothetical protein OEZ10_02880 [Gammaproteobacteria bacterium]|nr:hypothetical protein [Gammaproteobacteria bacterium]
MAMAKPPGTHKPSRKRTLEDVTRTLQDLVNNELSDASLRMRSLQERVKKARSDPDAAVETPASSAAQSPARLSPAPGKKPAANASKDNPNPGPVEVEGMDPEEWIRILGNAVADETLGGPATGNTRQTPVPAADTAPLTATGQSMLPAETDSDYRAGDQMDMWDDDIPVLRDVAAPPPMGEPEPATADEHTLSPKERGRKLAIRVIAKLNIELREKGKPELPPLIINRLQRILEQELAQQAANMDNSRTE